MRFLRCIFLLVLVSFLARPAVAAAITKFLVASFRLFLRRVLSLLGAIIFGMVDELVLHLDFIVKEALPPPVNVSEAVRGTFHLISHVFSGLFGAAIATLAHIRRQPIAAAP